MFESGITNFAFTVAWSLCSLIHTRIRTAETGQRMVGFCRFGWELGGGPIASCTYRPAAVPIRTCATRQARPGFVNSPEISMALPLFVNERIVAQLFRRKESLRPVTPTILLWACLRTHGCRCVCVCVSVFEQHYNVHIHSPFSTGWNESIVEHCC